MSSTLDKLRLHSGIVADTADFNLIASFNPVDATTNPSLILKAFPKYRDLVKRAKEWKTNASPLLRLIVCFGHELLKIIPGRVSTEVDAR